MRISQAIGISVLVAACGTSSDSSVSNELEFHGEQVVLPGWSKDTGLQPPASPVQLQLTFSAGGGITADAQAIAGGDKVAGVPGSGLFKLDAHITAAAMLHVDVSGLKYDGPVPGIENLDIAFGGETVFDPFLLDGAKADLEVKIPEIKLPPIPLPGGIPGNLQITIADGSLLRTSLTGTCAAFEKNSIEFRAKTTTGASVIVKSEIVIKVPVLGDKSFPIPQFTIEIPGVDVAMDMGKKAFAGGGAAPTGTSFAKAGTCEGTPNPDDGRVCMPEGNYTSQWHPPVQAQLCNGSQLSSFQISCFSTGSTAETCRAFKEASAANASCYSCLVTPDTQAGYGAIVRYEAMAIYNLPGCVAMKDPAQLSCAKSMQDYYACTIRACSSCTNDMALDACIADADATTCRAFVMAADTCFNTLPSSTSPAASCFTATDQYSAQFCGGGM